MKGFKLKILNDLEKTALQNLNKKKLFSKHLK